MKIGNGVFSSDWFSLGRNAERVGYCIKYWRRRGFVKMLLHLDLTVFGKVIFTPIVRRCFRPGFGWKGIVASAKTIELYITSDCGGGGSDYYLERLIRSGEKDVLQILVHNTACAKCLYVEAWRDGSLNNRMFIDGLSFFKSLPSEKCRTLVINELVRWGAYCGSFKTTGMELRMASDEIFDLAKTLDVKIVYLVHDYFAVCPRMIFIDSDECYCGAGLDLGRCRRCLKDSGIDIAEWREAHAELLRGCSEIRCFSEDSRRRLEAVFGPLDTMTVIEHQPLTRFEPISIPDASHTVIAVVGALCVAKGLRPVERLAHYIEEKNLDAEIVVVGDAPKNSTLHSLARITGRYAHDDLPKILESYGVNVAFFASIWPETFSYVTQELMMMNLPLVCLNLGAQAERVAKYPRGVIAESDAPEGVWNAICAARRKGGAR